MTGPSVRCSMITRNFVAAQWRQLPAPRHLTTGSRARFLVATHQLLQSPLTPTTGHHDQCHTAAHQPLQSSSTTQRLTFLTPVANQLQLGCTTILMVAPALQPCLMTPPLHQRQCTHALPQSHQQRNAALPSYRSTFTSSELAMEEQQGIMAGTRPSASSSPLATTGPPASLMSPASLQPAHTVNAIASSSACRTPCTRQF